MQFCTCVERSRGLPFPAHVGLSLLSFAKIFCLKRDFTIKSGTNYWVPLGESSWTGQPCSLPFQLSAPDN